MKTLLILSSFMSLLSFFSSAQPLPVGASVPSIIALNQEGDPISFNEVFSKGTTLVYFYPKAETPGCTAQACSLRDGLTTLHDRQGNKIQILGVSKDTPAAQKKFQQNHHLPFDLIADVDGKVAAAFGVTLIPVIGLTNRESFLIQHGKIVWSSLSAKTSGAAEEVQQALLAL